MPFLSDPPTHLFEHVGTFQTYTSTDGGTQGEHTESWADDPANTNIQCFIQPRAVRDRQEGGGIKELQEFDIYVAPDTAIYAGGRFTFTDENGIARTTQIRAVKEAVFARVILKLECVEVLT